MKSKIDKDIKAVYDAIDEIRNDLDKIIQSFARLMDKLQEVSDGETKGKVFFCGNCRWFVHDMAKPPCNKCNRASIFDINTKPSHWEPIESEGKK